MNKKKEKKAKKTNKKLEKDSQLLVRVNSKERDRFMEICEELDTTAAREIRRFMREFIEDYESL